LLDLNLGDMSGTDILTVLNQRAPDTVTILLTAHASLETAVEAVRQGAHDYLFKPCPTVELRESVRQGLLKRQQTIRQRKLLQQLGQYLADNLEEIQAVIEQPESADANSTDIAAADPTMIGQAVPNSQTGRFIQWKSLIVDSLRHVITLEGHLLQLSPTEFNLLAYLISEAPRAVTPQELTREVQGYESEPWEASEIARTHIYHIRQKIKKINPQAKIIRTVRGVGYAIEN